MKKALYSIITFSVLAIQPAYSMNSAVNLLSKTFKYGVAVAPFWLRVGVNGILFTKIGKELLLTEKNCTKMNAQDVLLFTNGNPTIEVYTSPTLSQNGKYSPAVAFPGIVVLDDNTCGYYGPLTLAEAMNNQNSAQFKFFAGLGNHETGHIIGNHLIWRMIFGIVEPVITCGAGSYIANKMVTKTLSTPINPGLKALARIPGGMALGLINAKLYAQLSNMQEYWADDNIAHENIDEVIRFLRYEDDAIKNIPPKKFDSIKDYVKNKCTHIFHAHPSFEKRIARLEKRKQVLEAQKKIG